MTETEDFDHVSIVDYGAGNIGSIVNMIKKLGGTGKLVSTPAEILSAKKLVLPGVGHFDHGMKALCDSGMVEALHQAVITNKTPILGICLGAQLMTRTSEEGTSPGLGWFEADVRHFNHLSNGAFLRVPHIGWNHVHQKTKSAIAVDLPENPRYYFVHSYFIQADHPTDVLFSTTYGGEFVSGLHRDNLYAVQFHPEKSHKYGLKLFENFLKI
jgi:glutamine amidotransferase